MNLACDTGRHKVSLVPRPFREGKERGPGMYSQQIRQYLPEYIRILCHCTNKPHMSLLRNYKDRTSIVHRVSLDKTKKIRSASSDNSGIERKAAGSNLAAETLIFFSISNFF